MRPLFFRLFRIWGLSAVREKAEKDKKEQMMLRIRNVLNIVFMILAVVGAVVYIKVDLETGGWIIGTAVVIKTVEVALRLFKV